MECHTIAQTRPSHWIPLLRGADADRAIAAVLDIGERLRRPIRVRLPTGATDRAHTKHATSSLIGKAGIALFCAYAGEALGRPELSDHAVSLLESAIDAAPRGLKHGGLFGGYSGLAWVLAHLDGRLFDSGCAHDNLHSILDAAACEHVSDATGLWNYDLISGVVGVGVHALERFPRGRSEEALEACLRRLLDLAEGHPDGAAWLTPPDRLESSQQVHSPHGCYNLGVAHGIPGIVAFLGSMSVTEVQAPSCHQLLSDTTNWLLRQQISRAQGFRFRNWIGPGATLPPDEFRLAWCYGDLGISGAFWCAGTSAQHDRLRDVAIDLARLAALGPRNRARVADAGLCHGAAGVAHIYNRLYQATGEPVLGDAARYWFDQTLAMRCHQAGVGGYRIRGLNDTGQLDWVRDGSFLTGAAGIGLALLAACTDQEPEWDRLLLLSARRARTTGENHPR